MLSKPFELLIRQLCEDILSEPTPEQLPKKIIDHVQSTFPVAWSTLWLTEQKDTAGAKRLKVAAAAGSATRLLTAENGGPAVYDFGEGLTGTIASQRQTLNIPNRHDFASYGHKHKYDLVMYGREAAGDLCQSVLGVPLLLKSASTEQASAADEWRVIGVLKLENVKQSERHKEAYFTEGDEKIVEAYAAVIAVALEKAQMRADSLRIGQGLLETSRSLLEQLGERPKLDEIVGQTANVISAEACALWLRSGVELRLAAAYGYPGDMQYVPPYSLENPKLEELAEQQTVDQADWEEKVYKGVGLTVYVAKATKALNLKNADEVRQHFAWQGANDQRMWKKPAGNACYSLVAIPLVDNETKDLKGVFKIENKKPTIFQLESYFTDEDEKLLTTLGYSISLSLIISERVERLRRLEKLVGNVRVVEGLDEALFFIATGLTHGGGLQYNRTMVFLKDEIDPNRFVCRFAIGQVEPAEWSREMDNPHAHKDLDVDALLHEFHADSQRFYNNPMMKRWKDYEFRIHDTNSLAVHAADAKDKRKDKRKDTAKYLSGGLQSDDPLYGFARGDFVLIPVRFEDDLEGIIYADNRFTGNRVNQFECEVLDLFAGMAGAIIEASKVPQKLRNERDEAWRAFSGVAAHRLGADAGIIDNEVEQYIKPELDGNSPGSARQVLVSAQAIEESLNVIRQSVNRLRRAVKDYQQLSSEPEPPEELDLCTLIDATVSDTTGNLRGINVEKEYRDRPIYIRARRKGLTYVLEELLINAWKEVKSADGASVDSGRDQINLQIQVHRDGKQVVCLVADDGPGIPAKLNATLFKKHGKGRRGGTGLGLYIIAQIIEDHGGKINLINAGKPERYDGACFRIILPS